MRAAREVFSELGYDAATFQAIAIRADLTRPAINHYFASKRVLWAEVVEQTNASIVSAGSRQGAGRDRTCSTGCPRFLRSAIAGRRPKTARRRRFS